MLLSDRFLGFFMVPAQGSWNYNFMGELPWERERRGGNVNGLGEGNSSSGKHSLPVLKLDLPWSGWQGYQHCGLTFPWYQHWDVSSQ